MNAKVIDMTISRPRALLVSLLALGMSATVFADESASFKLLKGPRYEADGYIMGAQELEGYIGAIMEDDGVTEVILVGPDTGNNEGEELFARAAKRAGVKALRKEKGETREL
jgi:hypothetical protein